MWGAPPTVPWMAALRQCPQGQESGNLSDPGGPDEGSRSLCPGGSDLLPSGTRKVTETARGWVCEGSTRGGGRCQVLGYRPSPS